MGIFKIMDGSSNHIKISAKVIAEKNVINIELAYKVLKDLSDCKLLVKVKRGSYMVNPTVANKTKKPIILTAIFSNYGGHCFPESEDAIHLSDKDTSMALFEVKKQYMQKGRDEMKELIDILKQQLQVKDQQLRDQHQFFMALIENSSDAKLKNNALKLVKNP